MALTQTYAAYLDAAAALILKLGLGARLAKLDLKSAYRIVPVHPCDRYLLGIQWNGKTYMDTCLPFGLRSAPKVFNVVADALLWIMRSKGVQPVIHYLDDYLFFGPPHSMVCGDNLKSALAVCDSLGVPVAQVKVEGPACVITYLGLELDTEANEIRLPSDKLIRLKTTVARWPPA